MNVLNLVTNDRATFFRNQVAVLERNGVDCTTLAVPGRHREGEVRDRSLLDYLRFYPTVLRHALGQYDLLHANYGLTAPFALAQPFLPVVVSLWGSDLLGKYGTVSKLCARRADAVIVMSAHMAREYGGECVVIPHGVDRDVFSPRPRHAARADLGWRHDAKHVLFPYSPSREVKDYPRARRVVEGARERLDAPVELQVVSDVPHERVATYMNAADVLLLTSKHEGSPNSVKEALACDLPVVSTDVGDVRERLEGVSPSFVCTTDGELVDALVTVLEREVRSNGREKAREISLERMADRLCDVYASVTEE